MTHQRDAAYDVVVVGSGAGAMTGAYLAAQAGLTTLMIEKTDRLGGTSAYSGAACWLPGTQVQERAGIGDSTAAARDYLGALLGDYEPERRDAFLAHAPDLVATLEEDPHLSFRWQGFPDYFDRPGRVPNGRSFVPEELPLDEIGDRVAMVRAPIERDRIGKDHHRGNPLAAGRALTARLLLAYEATGRGEVRLNTCMTDLVVEDGRVVGVEAVTEDGTSVRFGAERGVLLAAGGFERSADLRARHGVPGDAAWAMAPAGTNTGEPIEAAIAAGAATTLMDQAWWSPGIANPDGSAAFTLGFRGGLIVDGSGHRFANESLPYDQMGRQLAAAPGRIPAYVVFDSRFGGHLPAIALPSAAPEEHLAAGTWQRADTLAELADLIGVPGEALTSTVARFNGFAATGVDDDFGRGRDEYDRYFADPVLVAVDQPPYYAAKLVLADLGTKGGLVTDTAARVLRADGEPIPGLYAAGNTAASLAGEVYPGPGIPIGTAMVAASLAVADLTGSRHAR